MTFWGMRNLDFLLEVLLFLVCQQLVFGQLMSYDIDLNGILMYLEWYLDGTIWKNLT